MEKKNILKEFIKSFDAEHKRFMFIIGDHFSFSDKDDFLNNALGDEEDHACHNGCCHDDEDEDEADDTDIDIDESDTKLYGAYYSIVRLSGMLVGIAELFYDIKENKTCADTMNIDELFSWLIEKKYLNEDDSLQVMCAVSFAFESLKSDYNEGENNTFFGPYGISAPSFTVDEIVLMIATTNELVQRLSQDL